MCSYKTLNKNEHGYVVQCKRCQHLHVAFGTTLLALTHEQFFDFTKTVLDYYERNKLYGNRDEKRIQIPTALRSIIMVFTINELEQFRQLLQRSEDLLRREKLFEFNKN